MPAKVMGRQKLAATAEPLTGVLSLKLHVRLGAMCSGFSCVARPAPSTQQQATAPGRQPAWLPTLPPPLRSPLMLQPVR